MSSRQPPVKIDYAILCDDIRREHNNKFILIGVYSGDILVSHFPATLGLAAWLHGVVNESGEVAIEIRYRVSSEDEKPCDVTAHGLMTVKKTETAEFTVPLSKLPVKIDGPGQLSLDYRFPGGRWKNLLKKSVSLPTALTNGLERPS